MYGQGNCVPQIRHGSLAPPLPLQVPPPTTTPQPPFQQAPPTGTPPPPVQQGPPRQVAHQLPQPPPPPAYHHGPSPSQPVHYPPPGMLNMGQTYVRINAVSSSNYSNAPVANRYAQARVGAPYTPPMGNQGVHHIPPPPALAPTPRGLPPPGGQLLYRSPHPPPPGIQHVPTPPPPPPSNFVTVTPAPFVSFLHGSVDEAHPPSLPPPPPPPPPSSPPPVPSPPPPPSTHTEELPITYSKDTTDLRVTHDLNSTTNGPSDATQLIGDVLIHSGHPDGSGKVECSKSKEEPPLDLHPPPPRPADDIVHNIEALCKFMANVGPQFESLARVKEAGNPHFSFLFGGEPGSAAAVGYEYFQWMKRRYQLEAKPCNILEKIASSQTPSNPHSPMDQSRPSPAESDMEMDDDASQPERSEGSSELNKETNEDAVSKEERFHAPLNVTMEGLPVMSVPRLLPSSESFFSNPADHAASPEATTSTLVGSLQQSVRPAAEDATMIDIHSSQSDSKTGEVPRVLVKDGSPFRLIQGYASDDSVEDDKKELVLYSSSGNVAPSGGFDMSHENERAEFSLSVDLIDATKKSSQLCRKSAEILPLDMPTGVCIVGSSSASHDVASPKTVSPVLLHGVNNPNVFGSHHQDGPFDGGKGTAEVSSHRDIAVTEKDNCSQRVGEFCQENYATKDSILKVDEFGRMIREGASSSDSEQTPFERHGRRGRSHSRSWSPQQNRRSRSPWRWRERRSPSQSGSPRRQHSRSKSPSPPSRMGEHARRNHVQAPKCFNFLRGRCYRGTSCRFLHHDSGRYRNRSQGHRDFLEDSEKHVHSNIKSPEQSLSAKNTLEETAAVQQESFLLDGKCQELPAQTDSLSGSMKDEVLGGVSSFDSVKEDAEHFISHEAGQSQDMGDVDQELGSHEVLDPLKGSHHTEQVQEASGTSMTRKDNADKPPDEYHPLADDSLDDQVSPISEKQHPLGEGPGQLSSSEIPMNESRPSISVVTTQSETQNIALSQHLDSGLSLLQASPAQAVQPSDFQSQMPAAQPYAGEVSTIQSYPKPSAVSLSSPNQVHVLHHFAPQPPSIAGECLNTHPSQTQPLPFQGHLQFPSFSQTQPQPSEGQPSNYPLYASQPPRENFLQTSGTNFLSQPSPVDRFPPNRPSLTGDYHYLNAPPTKLSWVDLSPPPYGKETVIRPIPNMNSHSQFQPNAISLGGEFPQLHQHQVPHSLEERRHMHDFMQRPLPAGTQQGQTFGGPNFIREEQQYLRHPMTEGHQFPSSIHPLPLKREGVLPVPGYNIQSLDHRPFLREDFHVSAAGISYPQQASHGLQHPTGNNFPPNVAETGGIGPSRYPLSISDDNLSSRLSDVGLSKITVRTHYNPFASTFEQSAASSKYVSHVFRQEGSTSFDSKYDSSFGYGHRLTGGLSSTKIATSPPSAGPDVASLAKPGDPLRIAQSQELTDRSYPWQKSVEEIVQKQFRKEQPVGDQYDPLFDSIEPSLNMSKKLSSIQEHDPVIHDTDIASSVHIPADVEENNMQKLGPSSAAKIDNDEFGETAPDTEVGDVENGSPVLVDGREWSPAIPIDLLDKVMGEVEIDQVRTPGKRKKNKDSRSMKLFKIALADFVKEVLKPSWRQGNMSKEAFKTIVKKTVDKVSGSVSKHQIPKTQAKIDQYVESSQRKLTKLVMGYVDKYVKL